MGVQYFGATPVNGNNAYLSTTKNNNNNGDSTRPPDVVLQPCQEGLDFTLRLLAANRMANVVELRCDFQKDKVHDLTEQEVKDLFLALGMSQDENDDDDDDEEEEAVQDEYKPSRNSDAIKAGGLPHLQMLSIICSNATADTPSFIGPLTTFLRRSGSFPQFTHLTLQGVNLRGGLYELRGLAESFRLHSKVRYVQMSACWFTKEQQADMPALQQVFKEQEQKGARESRRSSQIKFGPGASSGVMYAGTSANNNNDLRQRRPGGKSNAFVRDSTEEVEVPQEETWWGEKILSFFCMFCPVNRKGEH